MQWYCESLTEYKRLKTREVKIGDLLMGNFHPIRIQTMTTTDTMDTMATVEQSIRCIEAGSELVRITAPSKREAENLLNIKNVLHKRGYFTPLVADIHFTPNAAEIAARIVEKVRVNPGNYVDKKKFEQIEYTDAEYAEEIERIRERFTPLVTICKEYGTAMRIGTNHGSLSDRIMSRYGDTPMGMVESAMEFLRIARNESYHNIVLSMKASNTKVMVEAYRLLVHTMMQEFNECYPLHLGVTEAGDGEDGRIKSAIGIGTLLEDGLGDTIRVSLTEDPEFEIPVCKDIVKRYEQRAKDVKIGLKYKSIGKLPYSPFEYSKRTTHTVGNIGGNQVPVVVADFDKVRPVKPEQLQAIGYFYDPVTDKWTIKDGAADFIFIDNEFLSFPLPGTLRVIVNHKQWLLTKRDKEKCYPLFRDKDYLELQGRSDKINFIVINIENPIVPELLEAVAKDPTAVLCAFSGYPHAMPSLRRFIVDLTNKGITTPVILVNKALDVSIDEQLIGLSTETGGLLLDGMGDGLWLEGNHSKNANQKISGRTYLEANNTHQFINNTSFSILQATRTRISKTEYISCPSCGRTLFDLQETTAKIRAVTHHLKGVKIAIMGCIVNGPGEMADADFGYVGSGPGKITLYRGKEIMKRNVDSNIAVNELIKLLKENGAWIENKK